MYKQHVRKKWIMERVRRPETVPAVSRMSFCLECHRDRNHLDTISTCSTIFLKSVRLNCKII